MAGVTFEAAIREQVLCRAALIAATGGGKTHGALRLAVELAPVEDIYLIDTEDGRARLEVDNFGPFQHGILPKAQRNPEGYMAAQLAAFTAGAKVVILDSVSPEWKAVLGEVDRRFGNWKDVRPKHDAWIETIGTSPGHLIVTMRAKMKYLVSEVEDGDRTRQQINPLGMGPIQDENLPYEFDIVAYLDRNHDASFSNRCRPLDGKTMQMGEAAPLIKEWLAEGEAPQPPPKADEKDVERLRELIAAKTSHSEEKVEETFAQRRLENRGELHPEYVADQIAKLEKLPDKTPEGEQQEKLAETKE